MKDSEYLKYINESNQLKNNSKEIYTRRLTNIKNYMWEQTNGIIDENTTYSYDTTFDFIISNPKIFIKYLNDFLKSKKGRQGETLGLHVKEGYVNVIKALFNYTPSKKQYDNNQFNIWCKVYMKIKKPLDDQYKSNKPTKRQEEAYIPFEELDKKRKLLPKGSPERLLLSMYTLIPPVRNDYWRTRIYKNYEDYNKNKNIDSLAKNYIIFDFNYKDYIENNEEENEENITEDNAEIYNLTVDINDDISLLVLNEYKTAKYHGQLNIILPNELKKEIQYSLDERPRDYLFVYISTGKPFKDSGALTKWANPKLKKLFNNEKISIITFRNIYVSRRDLELETKSGLERDKIAKIMGHSLEQQQKYLWHTYLKNLKLI